MAATAMSTPVLDRVGALIRRALDDGASEEEQRTSPMIAVRTIVDHGLVVVDPSKESVEPEAKLSLARRRIIWSHFAAACTWCGVGYEVGARLAWARGVGAICLSWWEAERACR